MARVRTQKAVASRIDLNYHRRPHPWRRTRVGLVVLCMLGAGAWFAFSSVRFKDGKPILIDRIHNPGPVARAHAQIEQDCKACHDGNGENGYWLSVSDQSCLKCHDGSLHHMNQKLADSHTGVNKAELIMAVKDEKHAGGALSANCISCHIEHRGHEALAGTSDQHCITCHENVDRALQPGANRESAVRVIAFNTTDHPRFGRSLDASASASGDFLWSDPTDVKYNHAKPAHANIPAIAGAASNCTRCHEVSNVPVTHARSAEDLSYPPFGDSAAATFATDKTSSYVQPISYDRHCIGCHEMKLPAGGPTIPHEQMSVVRAGLSNVANQMVSDLRSMSEADRKQQLTVRKKESNRPGAKVIETTRGEDEWLEEKLSSLARDVSRSSSSVEGAADALKRVGEEGTWAFGDKLLKGPSPAAMEFYVAFASSESCLRCHSMNAAPADFGAIDGATAPGGAPAELLATRPTGIPDLPRRWFGSSQFDHYAHRQMDCLSCHAAAITSEKTSDVLTADLDGRYSGAQSLNLAAASESCISCHHADTKAAKGAPANCVTCHEYHDHQFERSIDNPVMQARQTALGTAPTSQPAQ